MERASLHPISHIPLNSSALPTVTFTTTLFPHA